MALGRIAAARPYGVADDYEHTTARSMWGGILLIVCRRRKGNWVMSANPGCTWVAVNG
jgi:hypothetical protein